MDGFARRKEKSKEDIRKAAWGLFSQFGFEKVSIADIARKANVSPATIYNNFGSKEALIREFVTTVVEQLEKRVQDILAPDKLFWEKMAAFLEFISSILAQERVSAVDGIVFTSSVDLQNDPEIREIREAAQERMTGLLLGLVDEGKQQGQIDSDLSEEALTIYFRAFMDIFSDPRLQPQYFHDPRLVRDLGALLIYGLGGEQRRQ